MATIDMDKTIVKLLNGYLKYCENMLAREKKQIHELGQYERDKEAVEFLRVVAKDPKKYLYTGNDIFYTRLTNGKSIYDMLMPLCGNRFDRSRSGSLLGRLSKNIVHHVKYGHNDYNGVWVYYSNSGYRDSEAEEIIRMNKVIALWNSNDFVAGFKDFAPATVFAVKQGQER